MHASGRIWRRLALAIFLTALIPMLVATWLARSMVSNAADRFYLPEIGTRLDQSLGLYQELARSMKARMRAQARGLAREPQLEQSIAAGDGRRATELLSAALKHEQDVVSLAVRSASGDIVAIAQRVKPLDETAEHRFEVVEPLPQWGKAEPGDAEFVAVFAASKAQFDELQTMSQFVDTYRHMERRKEADERSYVYAFAALLGITIICGVGVGVLVARGVTSRVADLAAATQRVGAGDLSIRVPEQGNDELSSLARAFNRMLQEVQASRARIEYLQRIGAWQEMARRLAHEIKNPLTPIQLAVQELCTRYDGDDPRFAKLVRTTREIVEDEVQTLRRLVTEFSGFARLPQADLEAADLREYLTEQQERYSLVDEPMEASGESLTGDGGVELVFDLPEGPAPTYIDRQMLRRALVNLVRNGAQAARAAGREPAKVIVSLTREGEQWLLDVEDDGPGVADDLREVIFDPYVTFKSGGTGLGLAIVKKIVVEHGGSIEAGRGRMGGARMRIRLPAAGSAASRAVLQARQKVPASSRSGILLAPRSDAGVSASPPSRGTESGSGTEPSSGPEPSTDSKAAIRR